MQQAIIKKGKVLTEEVPAPLVDNSCVLIKVVNSCISAGTETSTVSNSNKSLYQKAKEKPEKVKKVVDSIKSEGIANTISMVKNELSIGTPTGYSVSGIIEAVGEGVENFEIGDYVAAASGTANHAEYVNVPTNLVCKLPKNTNFEDASSVALGAIALQGVRRADLKLGEFGVVLGTGILGLIAIQLLKSSGIRVAAIDFNTERLELAKKMGAEKIFLGSEDTVQQINNWTGGFGADAVLFTAATQSSAPLSNSFQMCKRKGKVVLVGVSGMEINRADIYPNELDFLVSTSYGPGRYDKVYEENGIDYPYAYVRWTENRNMQDYLRLIDQGSVNLKKIITSKIDIENISDAYDKLKDKNAHQLMIIVDYKSRRKEPAETKLILNTKKESNEKINIALVGAGSFAKNIHLPNLLKRKDNFNLHAVVNKGGYKGKVLAENHNAEYVTTNYEEVISDPNVDLVLICTRHNNHAELTYQALLKGKNVFVEKPLSANPDGLKLIEKFYKSDAENKPALFVGYNRRFSKYIREIKKHTDNRINPMVINYRMNAGFVPLDHWVHEDGGRIIGEFCHIIDLMTSLTNSKISSISYENFTPSNSKYSKSDNAACILKYEDGSIANLQYFSVGSKKLEKEYMEVHFDEKSIILNDYKSLKGFGVNLKEITTDKSDKGHLVEWDEVYKTLSGESKELPIPLWDLFQTSKATFLIK